MAPFVFQDRCLKPLGHPSKLCNCSAFLIGDKNKSGLIFLAATALLPKSSLRFFLARLAGFVMKQMEDEEPIEDKEMAFLNPSPLVDGSLRFNTNAKRERSDNIVKFLRSTGVSLQAWERFGGAGIDPVLPARR